MPTWSSNDGEHARLAPRHARTPPITAIDAHRNADRNAACRRHGDAQLARQRYASIDALQLISCMFIGSTSGHGP